LWSFAVFAINVVVSARLVLQVRRSGGRVGVDSNYESGHDDDRCRINTTPTTGFTWTSDLVVEPPPPPPPLLLLLLLLLLLPPPLLLLLLLLITSHTMPATATVFITNVSLLLSKVRHPYLSSRPLVSRD
jgi:hypothetical protein